jgi:hypothetical protein
VFETPVLDLSPLRTYFVVVKLTHEILIISLQSSFLMRSLSPSQDSDLSNSSSAFTPGIDLPENKAPNFLSAVPHQPQQQLLQQQQQQQVASQIVSPTPVTLGGGASSQMRAYQNLPSNARIIRGPNGQLSLQKIQTIELTPELQAVIFH